MDLDAPLDVTIGPYETYNDELFGYKAAFEAYVNLRDEAETAKLQVLRRASAGAGKQSADRSRSIRNPKLGALAPIRVVNEVFAPATATTACKPRPTICPTTSAWSSRRAASA